jgi:cytochrome c biogenesis protein
MSAAEETIRPKEAFRPKTAPILNRILDFLSSVRLGVVLLCVLVAFAMLGMLIMQQNVNGFEAYYASLTPAERTVYGALGLFDIYHGWYSNLLLLILSLNIVLASIDRFPSAWSYIVKPKTFGSRNWLLARKQSVTIPMAGTDESQAAERVAAAFKANRLKPRITNHHGVTFVFGESGKWNRLGAYIVHVALLTLFLGHFVALQTGFDADVRMIPGEVTDNIQLIQFNLDKKEKFNVQLPFSLTCTDIQQRLIDPNGSINVNNTLDWRTEVKVDDPEYGTSIAEISLNKPFTYRGYRFFQAQTVPIGNARTITVDATPQSGGDPVKVNIERNGSATMPDGTKIEFANFLPDFTFNAQGQPDTRSGDYNNPAAVLNVTPPNGEKTRVFAFAGKIADNSPVGAPKAGYKWRLAEFEKTPLAHVLSIKYDPYSGAFIAWYFGGFGLIAALIFVFFISHKRVWAEIEKGEILLAGEANRNHQGFEDKFRKITEAIEASEGQPNGRSTKLAE